MVALLRSREVGQGKITPGNIVTLWKTQINGRVSNTLAGVLFDQLVRIMSFPPRSEIHVTFCQLWLIPSPGAVFAKREIYLGLIAASESESTLLNSEFFPRMMDMVVIKQQSVDTVPNAAWETVIDGRQVWVDELFNTLGGVALESVPDGLYLYAQNTSTTDLAVTVVGRIHADILMHQENFADDYTQDGKRFTEGWSGYEWEESLGDAMELGTVDEAL